MPLYTIQYPNGRTRLMTRDLSLAVLSASLVARQQGRCPIRVGGRTLYGVTVRDPRSVHEDALELWRLDDSGVPCTISWDAEKWARDLAEDAHVRESWFPPTTDACPAHHVNPAYSDRCECCGEEA